MKIRDIILITFISVAIIASVSGISYFYVESYNIIENNVESHLLSIAEARADHIETYLQQNIERLKLVTSRTYLGPNLKEYIANPNEAIKQTISEEIEDSRRAIETFERICILDTEGVILASTNNEFCGRDVGDKHFFQQGKIRENIHVVEENGINKLFVSGPIKLDNELVGVGITVVKLDALEEIVRDRTGLGETGEVLIAMQGEDEIHFLFERLFEEEAIEQVIEDEETAEPMKQALLGNEVIFKKSLDYRDKEVIAVSQFIQLDSLHNEGIGLVAKRDIDEAFASGRTTLFNASLLVFVFILTFVIIVVAIVSRTISRPLVRLTENVNSITKGNLDIHLEKSNINEIHGLTDSLNRILASLKLAILRTGASKSSLGLGQAIAAKKEAELRYQEVVENLPDPTFVVNKEGVLTAWNKAIAEATGIPKEKMIGKGNYEYAVPFYNERRPVLIDLAMKTHEEIKRKYDFVKIKGNTILAEATVPKMGKRKNVPLWGAATPLFNSKGEIVGAIESIRDLTEEKRTEGRYKALYDSSMDAIMTIEPPSWKFTSGNPATIRMFGAKDEKDFTSRAPWQYSPKNQKDGKDSGEKAKAMIMKAMKDGSNFFDWTHKRLDGENFPATVLLTKVNIAGKEFLQATVRDLSKKPEDYKPVPVEKKLVKTKALDAVVKRAADAAKAAITKVVPKKKEESKKVLEKLKANNKELNDKKVSTKKYFLKK